MLLASSPTLAGIAECIKTFYAGEEKALVEVLGANGIEHHWQVVGSKGPILGAHVVKKGKRYRFEYGLYN